MAHSCGDSGDVDGVDVDGDSDSNIGWQRGLILNDFLAFANFTFFIYLFYFFNSNKINVKRLTAWNGSCGGLWRCGEQNKYRSALKGRILFNLPALVWLTASVPFCGSS